MRGPFCATLPRMRACENCGASLDVGERFCSNCGHAKTVWDGGTVIAALCCSLGGFALGVVGAYWSSTSIAELLSNVGAPPVDARPEFWVSKGASAAFLVELLVAIAVLIWLFRPRTLARWHPALRAGIFALCIGFLGLTSLCNVFSISSL